MYRVNSPCIGLIFLLSKKGKVKEASTAMQNQQNLGEEGFPSVKYITPPTGGAQKRQSTKNIRRQDTVAELNKRGFNSMRKDSTESKTVGKVINGLCTTGSKRLKQEKRDTKFVSKKI